MLELLLFVLLGILAGILFGLVPGLHPNFLVVLAPVLFVLVPGENLVAFIVSMAVANSISDFIPSILLGAPEEGTELSVSPGHRMMLEGRGYQAVKLAVTGGMLSVIVLCVLFPAVVLLFPLIYRILQPSLFFVLVWISFYMVLAEGRGKMLVAGFCFLFSGIIGVSLHSFPLDGSLSLFPVLSGLFGASILVMQFRQGDIRIQKQKPDEYVSRRLLTRSAFFGSIGGIFSGLLPGVGASQVASVATVDKNEKSFLVTLGALATANIVISIMSLWLINKSRSGVAGILGSAMEIAFSDVVLVLFVALFATAVAVLVTLKLSKLFLHFISSINYVLVSKAVFVIIVASVAAFTGIYGLLLFFVCASLGVFAYLSRIRMSVLMGVLLLPTVIFYFPF